MIGLRYMLLLLALACTFTASAQRSSDEQLAAHYAQQGDHEKAALYYTKLYKDNPSTLNYQGLRQALIGLQQFGDAEKLVKERMRRDKDSPLLLVDLGHVYAAQGRADRAAQQYDKAIKSLRPDPSSVHNLANAFGNIDAWDHALQTYQRGQRIISDGSSGFLYEIAGLYARMGNLQGMINSYLDLLDINPDYLQAVQNALGRYIDHTVDDERSAMLRTELLRRTQKNPDKILFQNLLIWNYVQQGDLNSAFVQSRALDKRLREGGQRLMDLGDIARDSRNWDVAVKCYDQVVQLGPENHLYTPARLALVRTMDRRVTEQLAPTEEDLQRLEHAYESMISDIGTLPSSAELLAGLARIKAFYRHDRKAGIALLERAINTPGLDRKRAAGYKLDQGDLLLMDGDPWEASLRYSQVDLDLKEDVLGHEARLRNAKVSFYVGDFLWCKAQLDVLKASTTKLIANDAMELSLLISDNLGVDSASPALSAFAHARLLVVQQRWQEATAALDALVAEFPMSELGDDVLYERYRIAMALGRYTEAAEQLRKIVEQYPNDILVDNAMLDLGKLYEIQLNDKEQAMEWYSKLLFEQTGSIFTPEARQRFRRLRGDHDNLETPEQKFLHGSTP